LFRSRRRNLITISDGRKKEGHLHGDEDIMLYFNAARLFGGPLTPIVDVPISETTNDWVYFEPIQQVFWFPF